MVKSYKTLFVRPKWKDHFGDLGDDIRIILKWILNRV
jgi:hypothetical protein